MYTKSCIVEVRKRGGREGGSEIETTIMTRGFRAEEVAVLMYPLLS